MTPITHPSTPSHRRARTRPLPQLSRRGGFWAVAFAFLALTAFATAPSALYGLYEQREHLAPITLTIVYAVYAVGVVASLLLAGHVSDFYGSHVLGRAPLGTPRRRASRRCAWKSSASCGVSSVSTSRLPLSGSFQRTPYT